MVTYFGQKSKFEKFSKNSDQSDGWDANSQQHPLQLSNTYQSPNDFAFQTTSNQRFGYFKIRQNSETRFISICSLDSKLQIEYLSSVKIFASFRAMTKNVKFV